MDLRNTYASSAFMKTHRLFCEVWIYYGVNPLYDVMYVFRDIFYIEHLLRLMNVDKFFV